MSRNETIKKMEAARADLLEARADLRRLPLKSKEAELLAGVMAQFFDGVIALTDPTHLAALEADEDEPEAPAAPTKTDPTTTRAQKAPKATAKADKTNGAGGATAKPSASAEGTPGA